MVRASTLSINTRLNTSLLEKAKDLDNLSFGIDIGNLRKEYESLVVRKIGEATYKNYILKEYMRANPSVNLNKVSAIDVIIWFLNNSSNNAVKNIIVNTLGASNINSAINYLNSLKQKESDIINGLNYIKSKIRQFVQNPDYTGYIALVQNLQNNSDVKKLLEVLDGSFRNNPQLYNKFWIDITNGIFPSRFASWAKNYPEFAKVRDIFKDLADIAALIRQVKYQLDDLKDQIREFDRKYQQYFGSLNINQINLLTYQGYSVVELERRMEEILKNPYIEKLINEIQNNLINRQNLTSKDVQDFVKRKLTLDIIKNISPKELKSLVIILGVFLETGVLKPSNPDIIRKYIYVLSQITEYIQWPTGEIDILRYASSGEHSSLITGYEEYKFVTPHSELLYHYIKVKYLPESLKKEIEKYQKINVVAAAIALVLDPNAPLQKRQQAYNNLVKFLKTSQWQNLKSSLDKYTKGYFEYIIEPAIFSAGSNLSKFERLYEEKVKKVVSTTNLLELYLDRLKVIYPEEYKENGKVKKMEYLLMDGKLYGGMNPNILQVYYSGTDLYYKDLPYFEKKWLRGEGFLTQVVKAIKKATGNSVDKDTWQYWIDKYFYNIVSYRDITYYLFLDNTDGILEKDKKARLNETGILDKYISLSLEGHKFDKSRIVIDPENSNKVKYINSANKSIEVNLSDFENGKDELETYIKKQFKNIEFQERYKLMFPISSSKIDFSEQSNIDWIAKDLTNKYIQYLEYFYIADKANEAIPYEDLYEFYKYHYIIFGDSSVDKVLTVLGLKEDLKQKLERIFSNFGNTNTDGFLRKLLEIFSSNKDNIDSEGLKEAVDKIFSDEEKKAEFMRYIQEFWSNAPLYVKQAICEASGMVHCGPDNLITGIPEPIKYYLIKRILLDSFLQTISEKSFYNNINALKGNYFDNLKNQIQNLTFNWKDRIAMYAIDLAKEIAVLVATAVLTDFLVGFVVIPLAAGALEAGGTILITHRLYTAGSMLYKISNGLGAYYTGAGFAGKMLTYAKPLVVEPFIYSQLKGEKFMDVWPYWGLGVMGSAAAGRLAKFVKWGDKEMGNLGQFVIAGAGGIAAIAGYEYMMGDFDLSSMPHQFIFMLMLYGLEKGKLKVYNTDFYKNRIFKNQINFYDWIRGAANNKVVGRREFGTKTISIGDTKQEVAYVGVTRMPIDGIKGRILRGEKLPYYILEDGKVVIDRKPGIIRNKNIDRYEMLEGLQLNAREGEYILNMSGSNIVVINPKQKVIKVFSPIDGQKLRKLKNGEYVYFKNGTSYKAYFINSIIKDPTNPKEIDKVRKKVGNPSEPFVVIDNLGNVYRVFERGRTQGTNSPTVELRLVDKLYNQSVNLVREIKLSDLYGADGTINMAKLEEIDKELTEAIGPQWEEQILGKTAIERLKGIHYSILQYLQKERKKPEELIGRLEAKINDIKILTVEDIKKKYEFKEIREKVFNKLKEKRQQRGKSPKEAEKEALKDTKKILISTLSIVGKLVKAPFKLAKRMAILTILGGGGLVIDYWGDNHLDSYDWIKKHFPALADAGLIGGGVTFLSYGIGEILSWLGFERLGKFLKDSKLKIGLGTAGITLFVKLGGKEFVLNTVDKIKTCL